MAIFFYKGYKEGGEEVKGVLEAPSKEAAVSQLKKRGIFPYEVREKEIVKKETLFFRLSSFAKKIPEEELIVFFRTLGIMINAGIPIVEALESLSKETENDNVKAFYLRISSGLKEGKTFTDSLKEAGIKDPILLNLANSGERTGFLGSNLLIAAGILEKKRKLKNKVLQAVLYPSILLLVSFSVVVFMLVTVVPKIVKVYATTGVSLPSVTRFTIALSEVLVNHYPKILLFLFIFVGIFYYLKNRYSYSIDRLKLRVGVLGKILLFSELQRFFSTLGILLKSGATLLDGIEIALDSLKNLYLKDELSKVIGKVKEGNSFSFSLLEVSFMPSFIVQLVKAGEESGKLVEMLEKIEGILSEEVNRKVENLTSLLEPATMLLTGLVVGYIIYSLLLPIVSISVLKGTG